MSKALATLLGVVTGAVLGAILAGGTALLIGSDGSCIDPECGVFSLMGALVYGFIGAVLGAFFGGLTGARIVSPRKRLRDPARPTRGNSQ